MSKINFTQRNLRAVAPPAGGVAVAWDTEVQGLALRVTASGQKTFYFQRSAGGEQYRFRIGSWSDGAYPETSIDAARKRAHEANVALAKGEDPRPRVPELPAAPELTLAGLWPVYLERHAIPRKKTVRGDKSNWKLYLAVFHDRPLGSITRGEVASWHVETWTTKGAATANKALALLRIMYRLAGDWDLYEGRNPASRIEKAPEASRQRAVERHEFPALLSALHAHSNDKARDALLLALWTGQRIGNVLAMRWGEITTWTDVVGDQDVRRGRWLIPRTKNDDPNAVPLADLAIEILEARQRRARAGAGAGPYVFPGQKAGTHLVGVSHNWATIKAEATKACPSLADLRIHDLRRTMASWQVRMGTSIAVAAAALGHRNIETTRKVYAIIDIEPRRIAMEAAAREMQRMAGTTNRGDDQNDHQQQAPGSGVGGTGGTGQTGA